MTTDLKHPTYGPPLSGRPKTVDGVVFRPYRKGIARATWVDDTFRAEVEHVIPISRQNAFYDAIVDGRSAAKRYGSFERAATVAVFRMTRDKPA